MIRMINVGRHIHLHCETSHKSQQPIFIRIYIMYHAYKVSFLFGCRLIIGLNGCFLKARFGGYLLSTIGRDDNDNIFSITMTLIEQENKDS